MAEEMDAPERARAFVLVASLLPSAAVWITVVRNIGCGMATGFLYFLGFFTAALLLLMVFGYSLSRGAHE